MLRQSFDQLVARRLDLGNDPLGYRRIVEGILKLIGRSAAGYIARQLQIDNQRLADSALVVIATNNRLGAQAPDKHGVHYAASGGDSSAMGQRARTSASAGSRCPAANRSAPA